MHGGISSPRLSACGADVGVGVGVGTDLDDGLRVEADAGVGLGMGVGLGTGERPKPRACFHVGLGPRVAVGDWLDEEVVASVGRALS